MMASVDGDRRASKDLPHLALSLDNPLTSSPFPSPSSSFIPPPVPNAHEFATKLPPISSKINGHSRAGSTSSAAVQSQAQSLSSSNSVTTASQAASATAPPQTPKRTASTASLNSSRPAPPSPSMSRRTSAAHTNRNSTASELSRASSVRRASTLLQSPTKPGSGHAHSVSVSSEKRIPAPIKIRDFAYPMTDPRHIGQGPDAPSQSQMTSMAVDDEHSLGWGNFRWTSKLWGFGPPSGGSRGSILSGGGEGPTRSDFARNFDQSSPAEEYIASSSSSSESETEAEGVDDDMQDDMHDTPLVPGLYRALYAFTPEGLAEMALAEDDIIRVVGRGDGVGWAIAQHPDGGEHGLVPESYLELIRADDGVGGD